MKKEAPKCKRCGKCCQSSSPVFHVSDLPLVANNHIDLAYLYTIRKGEYVWDNIERKGKKASKEFIKIRESETGCFFYEDEKKACRIYEYRPAQCKALFCEDTRDFFRVYRTPRLTRQDIVKDTVISRLVEEHDIRCSYEELEGWLSRVEDMGENAVKEIIKLLRFDYELRRLVREKLKVKPEHLDFLFGRPMINTIKHYGLEVKREKDGSFLLTIAQDCSGVTVPSK